MSDRLSRRSLRILAKTLVVVAAIWSAPALVLGQSPDLVRDPGLGPATASTVTPGTTVRSIIDPNVGDHWYAVALHSGDSLRVTEAIGRGGLIDLTSHPWDGRSQEPALIRIRPDGVMVPASGTYLVRYSAGAGAPTDWYELRFEVTPFGPASTPPGGEIPLCGDVRLLEGMDATPPGLVVCPGALITSMLTRSDPAHVFALDAAWGETISASTPAGAVIVEAAYPDKTDGWFTLPLEQLVAVPGRWSLRVRLPAGSASSRYTVRFDLRPAEPVPGGTLDIMLGPGCSIRRSSGEPLGSSPVQSEQSLALRVTNAAPVAQGLVIGPADASGEPAGDLVVEPFSGERQAREWIPAWSDAGVEARCTGDDGMVLSREPIPVLRAPRTIPDVRGVVASDATEWLRRDGLLPQETTSPSETVPAGHVVSTNPGPGATVLQGTAVTVTVSSGPQESPAPEPTPPDLGVTPDRTLPPGQETWPESVINASIALAAVDNEFRKAINDLATGAQAQDVDLLLSATQGLSHLADRSSANAQRLADFPELASTGAALVEVLGRIKTSSDAATASALAGYGQEFQDALVALGQAMADYGTAREPMIDAAELALIMRRGVVSVPPATSTASPRAPAPAVFSCDGSAAVRDPLDRAWTLSGIYWAERADYDRVTVRLAPDGEGDDPTRATVETVGLAELTERGLPAPTAGDLAIMLRFSAPVTLRRPLFASPDKTAVKSLEASTDARGRVTIVLGVTGRGCTFLQAPMWSDPSTQMTPFVDITVDVEH